MTQEWTFDVPQETLKEFCHKWKIKELSIFGSALRASFTADSDIDFLAKFAGDADWSVFDVSRMNDELSKLFGREVDIVEESGLRNPFRRREILANRNVIYVS